MKPNFEPGSIYKLISNLYIVIKKNSKFTGHWLLYDVKNGSLVHATADWIKSNLTEVI